VHPVHGGQVIDVEVHQRNRIAMVGDSVGLLSQHRVDQRPRVRGRQRVGDRHGRKCAQPLDVHGGGASAARVPA
jgi:hypothetical protein